jgi:hypothetical protein
MSSAATRLAGVKHQLRRVLPRASWLQAPAAAPPSKAITRAPILAAEKVIQPTLLPMSTTSGTGPDPLPCSTQLWTVTGPFNKLLQQQDYQWLHGMQPCTLYRPGKECMKGAALCTELAIWCLSNGSFPAPTTANNAWVHISRQLHNTTAAHPCCTASSTYCIWLVLVIAH